MPPRRTRYTSGDENHVCGPRFERTLDQIHRRSARGSTSRLPLTALRPRRNAHPSSRRQRPLQSRQHVTAQQTRVFRPLRRRSSALARHQLASRGSPSVLFNRCNCIPTPPRVSSGIHTRTVASRPRIPDDGRESPARVRARRRSTGVATPALPRVTAVTSTERARREDTHRTDRDFFCGGRRKRGPSERRDGADGGAHRVRARASGED